MACRPAPGKVDPALAKEQDRPMMYWSPSAGEWLLPAGIMKYLVSQYPLVLSI